MGIHTNAPPQQAGKTCPGEMTQAELNVLKTANGLKAGCSYVVTDPDAHGTLEVQKIIYQASDTGTVDARVSVITSHQPEQGWAGRLNFFDGSLVEMEDNIGNSVQGSGQVITFPWGDMNVHSNTLELDSTLSYTGGELVRTVVSRNSLLEMTKGSKVEEVNVLNGSTLLAEGTAVVQGSDIKNGSVCNIVASQFGTITLRTSVIESESTVNIENSLGLINNFSLSNKGTLTLKSVAKCAISKTAIDGANLTGTGTGNLNLSKTQIVAGSEVNVDGAGVALCLGVVIDSYSVVDITNGATVQLKYSSVSGATVRCEDAKVNLALTSSKVNTGAKLIVKDKTVFIGETTIAEHSTLTLTGGTGETRITRSNLSGYGVLAVSFNNKKVDIQGLIIESGQLDIKNGTGNYQLLWSRIAQAYLITADIGAGGIGNGLVASGNANSTVLPVGIGGTSTNF